MRALFLAAILAFSAISAPTFAQNNAEPQNQTRSVDWAEQIRIYLETQHQYDGYAPAGLNDWIGLLRRNRRESFEVRLEAGVPYRIIGVCDTDCADIDLEAFDSRRRSVAVDESIDDHPFLDITPLRTDTFKIELWIVSCRIELCFAGLRVLRRGAPGDQRAQPTPGQDVGAGPVYGTGTGFLVSRDGLIVTNYHVVEEAISIAVISGGRAIPATVVATDPANDVAILRAAVAGEPLTLANSRGSRRGDEVMTLGYPLPGLQGQTQKATFGRINALAGIRDDLRFMQIDIPIQPGNSGGPLVNARGEVIGIVSASISQGAVMDYAGTLSQNVNYAIKSEYIAPLLPANVSISGRSQPLGANFSDITTRMENSVFPVIVEARPSE